MLVCTNEQRTKQWEGFRGWLQRRGKDRYNVIIDGANLGYYKQAASSYDELADLQQVDWAVKKYEEEVRGRMYATGRERGGACVKPNVSRRMGLDIVVYLIVC